MENMEFIEKDKRRAKRRHQTIRVKEKRLKEIKGVDRDYYEEIVRKNRQGHFRKNGSFDCGHANCMLCHSDKLVKNRPHIEEELEEENENEV